MAPSNSQVNLRNRLPKRRWVDKVSLILRDDLDVEVSQLQRQFQLDNYLLERSSFLHKIKENQLLIPYTHLVLGVRFPIEVDIAKLLQLWEVTPGQLLPSVWLIIKRCTYLAQVYKLPFGAEEIYTMIKLRPKSMSGIRTFGADYHKGYEKRFFGVPASFKYLVDDMFVLGETGESHFSDSALTIRTSWHSAKDHIKAAHKLDDNSREKAVKNLEFWYDKKRNALLFDLSFPDHVVDHIFELKTGEDINVVPDGDFDPRLDDPDYHNDGDFYPAEYTAYMYAKEEFVERFPPQCKDEIKVISKESSSITPPSNSIYDIGSKELNKKKNTKAAIRLETKKSVAHVESANVSLFSIPEDTSLEVPHTPIHASIRDEEGYVAIAEHNSRDEVRFPHTLFTSSLAGAMPRHEFVVLFV